MKRYFCPIINSDLKKKNLDINQQIKKNQIHELKENIEYYESNKNIILNGFPNTLEENILWILCYKDNWVYGENISNSYIKVNIYNNETKEIINSWFYPNVKMMHPTICDNELIFSDNETGFHFTNISIDINSGKINNIIENHRSKSSKFSKNFYVKNNKVYIANHSDSILSLIVCDSKLNILDTIYIEEEKKDQTFIKSSVLVGFYMFNSLFYFHMEIDQCNGYDYLE